MTPEYPAFEALFNDAYKLIHTYPVSVSLIAIGIWLLFVLVVYFIFEYFRGCT